MKNTNTLLSASQTVNGSKAFRATLQFVWMSNAITSWQAGAVECVVSSLTVEFDRHTRQVVLELFVAWSLKQAKRPHSSTWFIWLQSLPSLVAWASKSNKEEECDAACASPNKLLRFHFQILLI